MINKLSSFFSSQINQIRPYLTPRVGLVSFVALGALSTLAFFFLRRKPTIPQLSSGQPLPQLSVPALKPAAQPGQPSSNAELESLRRELSASQQINSEQAETLRKTQEEFDAFKQTQAATLGRAQTALREKTDELDGTIRGLRSQLETTEKELTAQKEKLAALEQKKAADPQNPEPLNPQQVQELLVKLEQEKKELFAHCERLTLELKRVREQLQAKPLNEASARSELEDAKFEDNIEAITRFPKDNNAQIKSFSEGYLARADGYLRGYNGWVGTQLQETVPVIAKTLQMAHAQFETAYSTIAAKKSPSEKINYLRPLCDSFTQELNLLEGLENIHQVYNKRYEKNPETEGLKTLNALHESSKKSFESHQKKYQELIQFLKHHTPPPAYDSYPSELTASVCFPKVTNTVTVEEAAKSLSYYCQKYCPKISSKEAKTMIEQGQLLMQGILNGTRKPSVDLKESQFELTRINWFLKYCALQKNQGAHEWSFAIEDNSLYTFLMNSPDSYSRSSSHYIDRSPVNNGYSSYVMKSSIHHGLDVINGQMPAEKRTILFELVDRFRSPKKLLFFKPENYGTRGLAILMHAGELGESVNKKSRAQGEDDLPGMQKERVPDLTKDKFTALLNHIGGNPNIYKPRIEQLASVNPEIYDLNKAKNQAKLWGISYMHAFINGIKNQADCPLEFKSFAEEVENTWKSLDHLDKRTGREIYLSEEELKKFALEKLNLL